METIGEEKLVELNTLPEVTLYKAGHHGSSTSSSETLLEVIKPEIVVIPCVAGSYEYSDTQDNTFPTFNTLTNISKYTDKVYIPTQAISELINGEYETTSHTSLNGNIVVASNKSGVTVLGRNNNTILKDSDWYKTYRNNIINWN